MINELVDPLSNGLHWRCVGPPRGGRVVACAGDPYDDMTFYFGACAGGIWKTTDGGTYWRCISDGFLKSATIGALAVSEADPNVIYAGTGETTIRIDVSYGDGIYKSTDAGKTWRHMGLKETRHIGEIRIHPDNPDIVYVAALGHAFGENPERGVYRSVDGGENWELILHQSEKAGAIDISLDPNNPRIIFAAMWEAYRKFWTLSSGGPDSALFRSLDGGDTWEEVSNNPGFPTGTLGKIGVSISPAKSGRIWALVEAKDLAAGMYRSDDGGDSWQQVSPNRDLIHRPWYYTHVFADTTDENTVYVCNYQMWKSTDGGRNYDEITTPHGDNHDLWIDPVNNQRMVQGNDGGANVSFNGGATWSTIYNQMTAQFYRMDIDNQFPYSLYATQQDNTSICVPSATEDGVITFGDCTITGTGESGFIAVHPEDANIVYVGAVGSSPGGSGALQRYDHSTKQVQLISIWPEENIGTAPRDLKFRFAWTFPILFSPHDVNIIYAGGNHVFKTTNEGKSWEIISPDLSRNDVAKLGHSGGPLTSDSAGAETYASLSTLVESIHRPGELWAGTDDGLIHVSRDHGASWQDVTPQDMPEWGYVGVVEISTHDADTIYACATRFKIDDYEPYLFRTTNGGKSWDCINGDFPAGEITRVIRVDPVRKGLLFVGTETGVYYTLNDGANWTRMSGALPVVPVYDLKIKNEDLVVATHGRSFWIADDITPLRQITPAPSTAQLIEPRDTVRFRLNWAVGIFDTHTEGKNYWASFGVMGTSFNERQTDGSTKRIYLDVGENPPNGAIIYYHLDQTPDEPISLTIKNKDGEKIIAFSSADNKNKAIQLPAEPGLNRFVWNMAYPGPTPLDPGLIERPYEPLVPFKEGGGPTAPPGIYIVDLEMGGEVQSHSFSIVSDPRIDTPQSEFDEQFEALQQLNSAHSKVRDAVNRIRHLKRQLKGMPIKLDAGDAILGERALKLIPKLEAVEGKLVNIHLETPRDVLRHAAGLVDTIGGLMSVISISDAAPTVQARQVMEDVISKVGHQLKLLEAIIADDLAKLNNDINNVGIPALKA